MKNWIYNMLGVNLNEENMANIEMPTTELITHVTIKTVQAGTILGCLIVAPIFRGIKGPRTMEAIKNSAIRGGVIGAGVGAGLGPVLTGMKLRGMEEEGIHDRCYRLRFNRNQVRVDRGWILGTAVGMGASYLMASPLQAGFVIGSAGGVLLAAGYNSLKGGDKPV